MRYNVLMSNNVTPKSSGGIGFCGLLTIVFITLKLTNVINWSWFWVLSPMVFSIGLTILFAIVFVVLWIWANSR